MKHSQQHTIIKLLLSVHRFLTGAMSHEDAAKVQVGFGRCVYHWPVFAGDTIKKSYKVERVRNTSDGNHSVSVFLGWNSYSYSYRIRCYSYCSHPSTDH